MSTRSHLRIKRSDGKVTVQYVHFDGDSHLSTLRNHYNTQELADKLSALGDLSILDESPECPEGHSFDNRIPGYCVAYGRDRGEEGTASNVYDSFEEADSEENAIMIQFIYTWDGKTWKKRRTH